MCNLLHVNKCTGKGVVYTTIRGRMWISPGLRVRVTYAVRALYTRLQVTWMHVSVKVSTVYLLFTDVIPKNVCYFGFIPFLCSFVCHLRQTKLKKGHVYGLST